MVPASDRARYLTKRVKILCFIFHNFLLKINRLYVLEQLYFQGSTGNTVLRSHVSSPPSHSYSADSIWHWYFSFLSTIQYVLIKHFTFSVSYDEGIKKKKSHFFSFQTVYNVTCPQFKVSFISTAAVNLVHAYQCQG